MTTLLPRVSASQVRPLALGNFESTIGACSNGPSRTFSMVCVYLFNHFAASSSVKSQSPEDEVRGRSPPFSLADLSYKKIAFSYRRFQRHSAPSLRPPRPPACGSSNSSLQTPFRYEFRKISRASKCSDHPRATDSAAAALFWGMPGTRS